MATLQLEKTDKLLELAKERAKLPRRFRSLQYFDEVDLLVVEISSAISTHSKGDVPNGIIYNYDADNNLVSIEISDLYGIFASN